MDTISVKYPDGMSLIQAIQSVLSIGGTAKDLSITLATLISRAYMDIGILQDAVKQDDMRSENIRLISTVITGWFASRDHSILKALFPNICDMHLTNPKQVNKCYKQLWDPALIGIPKLQNTIKTNIRSTEKIQDDLLYQNILRGLIISELTDSFSKKHISRILKNKK